MDETHSHYWDYSLLKLIVHFNHIDSIFRATSRQTFNHYSMYKCILIYVYIMGNIILYSIVWKYNSNLTAPWLQKSVSLVQVKTCNRKFFSFFVNAKTFLSIYILICPLFISLRIYFPIFPYHLENFYMEWLGLLGKVTWHEFFYGQVIFCKKIRKLFSYFNC